MYEDIRGKRVLVSGAGTGIGRGIARLFASAGARVVIHYSHSEAGAKELVEEITGGGGVATTLQADFTSFSQIRDLGRETVSVLGGLDVIVNNAGISMNVPFENATEEQYDTLFRVNVKAPFFLTQTLLPELLKSRGAVINISSIHAFEALTEHAIYAATRGAIATLTRNLAIELAPRGVRVNCIAPGSVPVENQFKLYSDRTEEQLRENTGRAIPCGFAGRPADIGNVALFLASEASRYVVGQTLIVDGGTTSWMPFGEGYREGVGVQYGRGYVPGL